MSPEEIAASALAGMDTLGKNGKSISTREGAKKPKRRGPKPKMKFATEPLIIQTIPKRKEYVNHSYRDFSNVPKELDYEAHTKIEDMSFSEKVHIILAHEEHSKYIKWMPHGRCFFIANPKYFERTSCEKYFGHKRYSSFLRQVNNYGFKHISRGPDRNCYYHECFLKGMVHLCKYMPEPKDARRQIPDPENEPDFGAISRLYPLPSSTEAPAPASDLAAVPVQAISAATSAPPAVSHQKAGMDRNTTVAEIKNLRVRLASENPSLEMPEPKRQAVLVPGMLDGQTPERLLSQVPQPFPSSRARGVSQLEAILQRNAIVSAIRDQKQKESQQQHMQEIQVQHQQLQDLRAQKQLEEIQAQRRLQDLKAQQTMQQLQTQHAVNEFQKQQALQELQMATKMAQQLQQQQQIQGFRNHLALQNLQQQQPPPSGLGGLNNASSVGEYLRLTSRFP